MSKRDILRPIERAVLRLRDEGHSYEEIGRRFRRSSDHIERVVDYTQLPGRTGRTSGKKGGLRPLERRVLYWRERGLDHSAIGKKFRRSADHVRRVEGLAYLRKGLQLLEP